MPYSSWTRAVRTVRLLVGPPTLGGVNRLTPRASRHRFRTMSSCRGCEWGCSLCASLVGHQVEGRASAEPIKFLLIQAHTATTTLDIDMAAESGSTDFDDFFYGVRASFIHLLLSFSEFSMRTDHPLSLPRTSSRTSLYRFHPPLYPTSRTNTIFSRIRQSRDLPRGLHWILSLLLVTTPPRWALHLKPSSLSTVE